MFSEEARGGLPKGTAERWAKHTPDIKSLPQRVVMSAIKRRIKKKYKK